MARDRGVIVQHDAAQPRVAPEGDRAIQREGDSMGRVGQVGQGHGQRGGVPAKNCRGAAKHSRLGHHGGGCVRRGGLHRQRRGGGGLFAAQCHKRGGQGGQQTRAAQGKRQDTGFVFIWGGGLDQGFRLGSRGGVGSVLRRDGGIPPYIGGGIVRRRKRHGQRQRHGVGPAVGKLHRPIRAIAKGRGQWYIHPHAAVPGTDAVDDGGHVLCLAQCVGVAVGQAGQGEQFLQLRPGGVGAVVRADDVQREPGLADEVGQFLPGVAVLFFLGTGGDEHDPRQSGAVLLHQAVQHAVNAVGQLGGVVVVGQAIHHGFQLQIVRLTVTKRRDLGPEGVQRERLAVQARAGQAV